MSRVRGIPTRVVVVTGLLLALLLAGVGSYYAASSPDGLKRVAQDQGFAGTQQQRNDAAPFAGYQTAGVHHDRLSGGLAGVTGCLVVLALAGGGTWLLRRRRPEDAQAEDRKPAAPAVHR